MKGMGELEWVTIVFNFFILYSIIDIDTDRGVELSHPLSGSV